MLAMRPMLAGVVLTLACPSLPSLFPPGVVIISHHNEFTTALCPEKWTVADGKVVVTGAPQVLTREKVEFKVGRTCWSHLLALPLCP